MPTPAIPRSAPRAAARITCSSTIRPRFSKCRTAKSICRARSAQHAPQFITVAEALLRTVALRWNLPEHLVTGSAANNNFASSLVAETPFVKYAETQQQYYARRDSAHAGARVVVRLDGRPLRRRDLVADQALGRDHGYAAANRGARSGEGKSPRATTIRRSRCMWLKSAISRSGRPNIIHFGPTTTAGSRRRSFATEIFYARLTARCCRWPKCEFPTSSSRYSTCASKNATRSLSVMTAARYSWNKKGTFYFFGPRGRPRGRMVDCRPRRLTAILTQFAPPYGVPRAMLLRIASASAALCGSLTRRRQSRGRATGAAASTGSAASARRQERLDQGQFSAHFTRPGARHCVRHSATLSKSVHRAGWGTP